jgi:hypothetical protein
MLCLPLSSPYFPPPPIHTSCPPPQKEAAEYLSSCSCPVYLERTERRLAEEVERCALYLDGSTEPKITRVVETELISKQVCVWVCGCVGGDGALVFSPDRPRAAW